jgi:SAM-dependent methyltransferase
MTQNIYKKILYYCMSQKTIDFFTESCEKHGDCSWAASKLLSEDQQYATYIMISRIGKMDRCNVLDVGCGQGSLSEFIKNRFVNIDYEGIDITPKMIEIAKKKYPNTNFMLGDFISYDIVKNYDWILAAGAFNVRIEGEQMPYLEKAIKKMFDYSNKGIAFTLLSSHGYEIAKTLFKERLYFYEPSEILSYCLKFTSSVVLNHASLPAEFIVYLYKE